MVHYHYTWAGQKIVQEYGKLRISSEEKSKRIHTKQNKSENKHKLKTKGIMTKYSIKSDPVTLFGPHTSSDC